MFNLFFYKEILNLLVIRLSIYLIMYGFSLKISNFRLSNLLIEGR